MARFPWCVALMSCIAATSVGQGPPPSQAESGQSPAAAHPTLIPRSHEQREARYRALHHIILNVLAVDDFNMPVTGLKAQDFLLLDNGQPQEFATFRAVNADRSIAPPHVVIILDALNNSRISIEFQIKEIDKYLGSNQQRLIYPTSIATLTTSGFNSTHPSIDASALLLESQSLLKDIHPYQCKSSSDEAANAQPLSGNGNANFGLSFDKISDTDCLNERFTVSLTALSDFAVEQKNVLGRVIVIWIGPGWPLLTAPGRPGPCRDSRRRDWRSRAMPAPESPRHRAQSFPWPPAGAL